jgi:hypothetical protein
LQFIHKITFHLIYPAEYMVGCDKNCPRLKKSFDAMSVRTNRLPHDLRNRLAKALRELHILTGCGGKPARARTR